MAKKILIIVGGGTKHVFPFNESAKDLGIDVVCVSFSKLEYLTEGSEAVIKIVGGVDVSSFDLVYIRLTGRRYEDVALLVYYLRQKGVKIVDSIYESNGVLRVPLPKSIEMKMLYDAGLLIPRTYFGRMKMIASAAPNIFGFPFVIKSTTGKQGHAVWSLKNDEELSKMVDEFTPLEKKGELRFIAQEFIKSSQRMRIFVIGDRVVGGITRPTRWRKRFIEKVGGNYPDGERKALNTIPSEISELAVKAAKSLQIDIAGVDLLMDDQTGKSYVLEVNSAPRWEAISKDTGINIEKEILKYLSNL